MSVNTKVNGQLVKSAGLYKVAIPIGIADKYSLEERRVGVWTDGKPLYQKTFVTERTNIAGNASIDISTDITPLNVDLIVAYKERLSYSVTTGGTTLSGEYYSDDLARLRKNGSAYAIQLTIGSATQDTLKITWTIQYTKSTDVPGSGVYASDEATLAMLGDVDINTPTDGQALVYNLSSQKWVNGTGISSEVKTSSDGQFNTVTGGLMQSCLVDLEPIQSGSGTPSPSNVRAISGHTSVDVRNWGKNKLPLTVDAIKSANTGGTWNGNVYTQNNAVFTILTDNDGNVIGIKLNGTPSAETTLYISFKDIPTGDYYFSGCANGGSDSNFDMFCWDGTTSSRLKQWDGTTNSLSIFNSSTSAEIKVSDSTHNMTLRIRVRSGYQANNLMFYPMIRLGNVTDATFVPYNGYTTIINLGGTYYGGTLDAVSGKLTVTHALYSDTWGNGTGATDLGSVTRKIFDFTSVGLSKNEATASRMNCADYLNSWADNSTHYAINASSHKDLYLFLPNGTSNDFVFQLCYELATPQTIQLTPKNLETLVGQNDVFAPLVGQSLDSLTYREVLAWDDVERAVAVKLDLSSVAPIEYTDKASQSYNQKQLFIKDNKLCQALASISSGASFTENTNFKYTTLAEIIEPLIP